MLKKIINKILTIIFIIDTSLLIVSSSILVPCVDRNFYFIQMDNLGVIDETDPKYTEESIKNSFNELLDFIWENKEFSVGEFNYSESGKDHFIDCKKLFKLDLYIFIISIVIFITILVLNKFRIIELYYFNKLSPVFYSSISIVIIAGIIGIFAITDFDRLFDLFHMIAFPGKTNWMFNPYTDEIIWVLTEDYFMSCGLLIIGLIIIECLGCIIYSIKKRKKDVKIEKIN